MKYSTYQKKIFRRVEDTDDNIVIDAVAGSGKSTTLFKIASLLPDSDILFFAFNNHIAQYATKKLSKLKNVKVQTTHSYGLSCIRASKKMKASEMNTSKVWNYIEANVTNFKLRGLYYNALTTLRSFGCMSYTDKGISKFIRQNPAILNQIGDTKVLSYSATIGRMLKELDDQTYHYDFDDMLRLPILYNLLSYGTCPDLLLVDESQDLNSYQFEFLQHFVDNDTRIIAVGDDDQAIYSFRGACGDALDTIRELCGARRMPLSITYRCKSKIVDFVHKQYEQEEYEPAIEPFEKGGAVYRIEGHEKDEYGLATLLKNKVEMVVSAKNKHIISIWFFLLEQYGMSSSLKGSKITTMLTKQFKGLKAEGISYPGIFTELKNRSESTDEAIADMAAASLRFVSLQAFSGYDAVFAKLKQLENDTTSKIHLHTVHSAKGMESERVFVIDDWFDSDQKLNMKYVGFTRASDELYVVKPYVPKADLNKARTDAFGNKPKSFA